MSKPTVAVDLDGPIFKFKDWKGAYHFGKPEKDVIRSIQMLKKMGFKISVYTNRLNPITNDAEPLPVLKELVKKALEQAGIPFDEISVYKPLALYYIDDRAVRFVSWEQTLKQIVVLEKHRANQFE